MTLAAHTAENIWVFLWYLEPICFLWYPYFCLFWYSVLLRESDLSLPLTHQKLHILMKYEYIYHSTFRQLDYRLNMLFYTYIHMFSRGSPVIFQWLGSGSIGDILGVMQVPSPHQFR